MDSLDLEAAIQADLFSEWTKAADLGKREAVHRKLEVHDTTMKILRRIANG